MPRDVTRCIFLTGAPDSEQLDWSEDKLLSSFTLGRRIRAIDDLETSLGQTPSYQPAKWRLLPFGPAEQQPVNVEAESHFISFHGQADSNTVDEAQNQFLEHSLLLIEDLASSQITPTALVQDPSGGDVSFLTSISSETTSLLSEDLEVLPGILSHHLPITDLRSIPSATHLTRLHPQTITINLLAAIISITPPRTVCLRRRARNSSSSLEKEIIEVLLGDETRAGFSVSFWLSPVTASITRQTTDRKTAVNDESIPLRRSIHALRPGDVVVLANVALSAWRGSVYGQSLSRRFARNSTTISLLRRGGRAGGRKGITGVDVAGLPAVIQGKFGRVKDWSDSFVGGGRPEKRTTDPGSQRRSKRLMREVLPPDESQLD